MGVASAIPETVERWAEKIRAGDVRAIARAITAVENQDARADELLKRLFPATGGAYLIGCTGAPGTGKSTLVDRLAAHYRSARTFGRDHCRRSHESFHGRRDSRRSHPHARSHGRFRDFHSIGRHARISWAD